MHFIKYQIIFITQCIFNLQKHAHTHHITSSLCVYELKGLLSLPLFCTFNCAKRKKKKQKMTTGPYT